MVGRPKKEIKMRNVSVQLSEGEDCVSTLVHGGPGKAGGGEELGGRRGLEFYWQRTAIQGDRALLEKIFS